MRIGAIWKRWIEILATLFLSWRDSRRERRSLIVTRENEHVVVRRAEPIGHLAKFNAWGARSEEIIGSEASRPLLKALHAEIDPSRSGQFVAFLTAPRRAGVRLLQNLSGAEIARC